MTRAPSTSRVRWRKSYRIIPSRYPPIALFERVADPQDWDALVEVASLTNARIRDEIGDISLVDPRDRVSGPGASWVMAAFTHVGHASRFSDGRWGVYYAGHTLLCAIAETAYHYGRFYRTTGEPALEVGMRVLDAGIDATLHDLRGRASDMPAVYDRDDYSESQKCAEALRARACNGLVYDSVRLAGHLCVAAFRPRVVRPLPSSDRFLAYHWNGERIDRVFDYDTDRWQPVRS